MESSYWSRGTRLYGAAMSRIHTLNQRYAASAALVLNGVEIVAVGDPVGARLNTAVRRLLVTAKDDGPDLWGDLIGSVKALRWRVATQPQPIALNAAIPDAAEQVVLEAQRLRGAVLSESALDELVSAAEAIAVSDSPLGDVLLRSIEEVGPVECVVVAASKPAQVGLDGWLAGHDVCVLTVGELERYPLGAEQAYVVGPPRLFRSSLVTAPVTSAVSFLIPSWFADRSIPRSAIAAYADGAIRIEARVFTEGDVSEPESTLSEAEVEDEFLPQPVWGEPHTPDREPTSEEVLARKVFLSGDLAIWLDDGERIRSLAPGQPSGERVTYTEVGAVSQDTYLLLRTGETERGALYRAAIGLLGARGTAIDAAQQEWKSRLGDRIARLGYRTVVSGLRQQGVRTADRARAWTEPNLVRPHSDHDFELLLSWLDLPIQPIFGYATMLRRALYQASAEIGEQLEAAAAAADMTVLEHDGNLNLNVQREGFRGIIATRVLSVSPHSEVIPRHDARVPIKDEGARWLE